MNYVTEPLNADHDRSAFSCGDEAIDRFIRTQASKHMKKSHASVVFVFSDEKKRVRAFYTLSANGIPYNEIPAVLRKIVPQYKSLPVTLIGQLAVDTEFQNNKLGTRILMDALVRSYDLAAGSIGSIAVVVDPANSHVAKWYKKFGFIELPDQSRLFIPMKTIDDLFSPKK